MYVCMYVCMYVYIYSPLCIPSVQLEMRGRSCPVVSGSTAKSPAWLAVDLLGPRPETPTALGSPKNHRGGAKFHRNFHRDEFSRDITFPSKLKFHRKFHRENSSKISSPCLGGGSLEVRETHMFAKSLPPELNFPPFPRSFPAPLENVYPKRHLPRLCGEPPTAYMSDSLRRSGPLA